MNRHESITHSEKKVSLLLGHLPITDLGNVKDGAW